MASRPRPTRPSATRPGHAYHRPGRRADRRQGRRPGGRQGVVVAMSLKRGARGGRLRMLVDNTLGVTHNEGGARVVIEVLPAGRGGQLHRPGDGRNITALATSQDHKRLLDADQGPNTGGMGPIRRRRWSRPGASSSAMDEIILPTIAAWRRRHPVHRLLYAGLMIDARRRREDAGVQLPHGRPETQPIMMRLKVRPGSRCCWPRPTERLDQVTPGWDERVAMGVVLAAGRLPDDPRRAT